MQKLKFDSKKRALIIVAHPDDETIWMGGFILQHPQMRWTIFSLCRASDNDRKPKFKRICKIYGAKAIITDLEDEGKLSYKQSIPIIKKLITDEIGDKKYDYIFTHGENGEYGHARHKGIHQAVVDLVKKKKLKTKNLLCFNYKRAPEKSRPSIIAKKNSDIIYKLSKATFIKKKKLHAEIHGYDYNGIDVGYCANPEAFCFCHFKP